MVKVAFHLGHKYSLERLSGRFLRADPLITVVFRFSSPIPNPSKPREQSVGHVNGYPRNANPIQSDTAAWVDGVILPYKVPT